jgi:hypothetical protein
VALISRTELYLILAITHAIKYPLTSPNNTQPPDNLKNFKKTYQCLLVVHLSSQQYRKVSKKTTIAVPSFKRLSPSIIVEILLEAPKVLSKATTATGSVADIMEPNIKDVSHVNGVV